MELLNHSINKRIIAGNLPLEKLYVTEISDINPIDFEKEAEKGLSILKKNSKGMPSAFYVYREQLGKVLSVDEGILESPVNMIINTGYLTDSLNENKSTFTKSTKIRPYITELDRIIWFISACIFNMVSLVNELQSEDTKSLLYAWIYLLYQCEEKEYKNKKTVSVDALLTNESILDILLGDWTKSNENYFVSLTDNEIKQYESLSIQQSELRAQVKKELDEGKEYALKTSGEWETYIKILDDLAEKERITFELISEAISSKAKYNSFNEYEKAVMNIERGKYYIDDKEINLLDLYETVLERYKEASPYCRVAVVSGASFRLHYAAFSLAMNPKTYIYYLMKYHQLRLVPSKDTARKFVSVALESLCRNIGIDCPKLVSVEEMIIKYKDIVEDYYKKNITHINELDYRIIQTDAISILGFSEESYIDELAVQSLRNQYCIDKNKTIEEILSEDAVKEFEKMQVSDEAIHNLVKARKIIISLNMIYLFAEAIEIIITDRHITVVKNKELVNKCKFALQKIDSKIINRVYGNISDEEMDIFEYREVNGIDARMISDRERQIDEYENNRFAETLKTSISTLIKDINSLDINGLFEAKKQIIEKISSFPLCREKEIYADWVDDITQNLCEAMINICKAQSDDYEDVKNCLLSEIGKYSAILPEATVDSLTTAEILYSRYANDNFAQNGFDYSSISALYYQAFENAYNILIWQGYAKRLDNLSIDDKLFTDYLKENQYNKIRDPKYKGYLDARSKQRAYYVEYSNETRQTTQMNMHCMYMSFAILMENINPNTWLDKYCDYFAEIVGFEDKQKMFADFNYINMVKSFTDAIKDSTPNRNNASHGGTIINIEQCSADKETVLSQLDVIRNNNLGLIHQLLTLLTYKK